LITPSYETGYRYLKDELLAGQKSLGTTTVLSCICRTSVREAVIANVAIRHCAMYCPHPHPHYYPHNAPLICNRKRMKPHKIPPNKQPPLYVASRVSLWALQQGRGRSYLCRLPDDQRQSLKLWVAA